MDLNEIGSIINPYGILKVNSDLYQQRLHNLSIILPMIDKIDIHAEIFPDPPNKNYSLFQLMKSTNLCCPSLIIERVEMVAIMKL